MPWFYSDGKTAVGPRTDVEIQAHIACSDITSATLVWKDGMPAWARADQSELAPQLKPLVAACQPPPLNLPPPLAAGGADTHVGHMAAQVPDSAAAKAGSGTGILGIAGIVVVVIACFILIGLLPMWARPLLFAPIAYLAHRGRKAK